MKKEYEKPQAEVISFELEEKIMTDLGMATMNEGTGVGGSVNYGDESVEEF